MKKLIATLCVAASSVAPLAQADIAIVVHPANPIASLSPAELSTIYLSGEGGLRPIDLPDADGLQSWFYHRVTGRDATQIRILRARQVAKAAPPIRATSSIDAIRRVAGNKHAIAYVDARVVDPSVKVVMTIATPEVLDRLHGRVTVASDAE